MSSMFKEHVTFRIVTEYVYTHRNITVLNLLRLYSVWDVATWRTVYPQLNLKKVVFRGSSNHAEACGVYDDPTETHKLLSYDKYSCSTPAHRFTAAASAARVLVFSCWACEGGQVLSWNRWKNKTRQPKKRGFISLNWTGVFGGKRSKQRAEPPSPSTSSCVLRTCWLARKRQRSCGCCAWKSPICNIIWIRIWSLIGVCGLRHWF